MNTLPLGSDAIDRWGNPHSAGQTERRLKISFTKDLLPSFFLAIPFLAIAYSLTGGVSTMLQQIEQHYGSAPAGATAMNAAACTTAVSTAEACTSEPTAGALQTVVLD